MNTFTIVKTFSFNVGVWAEDGTLEEMLAEDLRATSAAEALVLTGASDMPRAQAMAIHYVGSDGLEYDFR